MAAIADCFIFCSLHDKAAPFYKMFLEATAILTFSSYSTLAPCSPVYWHLIEMMWWLTDPANFSYASSFLTCLWLTEEKTLFSNSPVLLRTNFTKTYLLRRRTTNVMLSQLLNGRENYYRNRLLMLHTGSHVPVCLRWQCKELWESYFLLLHLRFWYIPLL